MRFIYGQGWTYEEEATDGTQGGAAGGGAASGDDADGEDLVEGDTGDETAQPGAGAKDGDVRGATADKTAKVEAPKDMKAAIDAALGYKKGPNGEALDPLTGKVKPDAGEKKPNAAAGDGKETETHHANGTAKKGAKGEALDDKGQVVTKAAPKVKTSAELALKPEELKALGAKTGQRFTEMIGTLKSHEGTIAKQGETIKVLSEARDAILGVLQDTGTTQEQLGGYLEFNRLLHSSAAKDLEAALGMVESQRAAIYKALGREPKGGDLDLLAEFADLQQKVADGQITREDALELANGRREKAARDSAEQRQQQQQRQQTQTEAQAKQAADNAVKEIEKWTASLAKDDLDYKAKEDKLLSKLDGVLKEYPPNQWLSTLKLLYDGIEITKAPAGAGGSSKPIRPSGVRPGAKAPNSMLDAINQGLGYAGAEKG